MKWLSFDPVKVTMDFYFDKFIFKKGEIIFPLSWNYEGSINYLRLWVLYKNEITSCYFGLNSTYHFWLKEMGVKI